MCEVLPGGEDVDFLEIRGAAAIAVLTGPERAIARAARIVLAPDARRGLSIDGIDITRW
jgi:hypothetical protein